MKKYGSAVFAAISAEDLEITKTLVSIRVG